MEYELAFVRIWVKDWPTALEFYTGVLGMRAEVRDDQAGWAQLDTGTSQLCLERIDPGDEEADDLVGRFVGVSFIVPDVEAIYDQLAPKGVEFSSAPEEQPWGAKVTHVRDPEGNVLTLMSFPE